MIYGPSHGGDHGGRMRVPHLEVTDGPGSIARPKQKRLSGHSR
jgi:hypothetical protein